MKTRTESHNILVRFAETSIGIAFGFAVVAMALSLAYLAWNCFANDFAIGRALRESLFCGTAVFALLAACMTIATLGVPVKRDTGVRFGNVPIFVMERREGSLFGFLASLPASFLAVVLVYNHNAISAAVDIPPRVDSLFQRAIQEPEQLPMNSIGVWRRITAQDALWSGNSPLNVPESSALVVTTIVAPHPFELHEIALDEGHIRPACSPISYWFVPPREIRLDGYKLESNYRPIHAFAESSLRPNRRTFVGTSFDMVVEIASECVADGVPQSDLRANVEPTVNGWRRSRDAWTRRTTSYRPTPRGDFIDGVSLETMAFERVRALGSQRRFAVQTRSTIRVARTSISTGFRVLGRESPTSSCTLSGAWLEYRSSPRTEPTFFRVREGQLGSLVAFDEPIRLDRRSRLWLIAELVARNSPTHGECEVSVDIDLAR